MPYEFVVDGYNCLSLSNLVLSDHLSMKNLSVSADKFSGIQKVFNIGSARIETAVKTTCMKCITFAAL